MNSSENSLPDSAELPPKNRGRWVLIMIFSLFFAPIVAALFLNSRLSDWRPSATKNFGQLIVPVVPIGSELPSSPADDLPPWRLIWPVVGSCESACKERIETLARIQQTLGRHRDKLEIWALNDAAGDLDPGTSDKIRAALVARELTAEGLYLVDPLGNVMMFYPPDSDTTGLRKDLDRLIRHSKFKS
ncbi:MAG: hypothetical protein AB8B96_00565 [Lysobacterales bacterium]